MLTVITIVTLASLGAFHLRIASLRCLVMRLAAAGRTRERRDATVRRAVAAASADLRTAFAELHDEIKAERITRSAADVATRIAERKALRALALPVPSTVDTITADDRETLETAPPADCEPGHPVPRADVINEPDPTSVLSREALAAALRGSPDVAVSPPCARLRLPPSQSAAAASQAPAPGIGLPPHGSAHRAGTMRPSAPPLSAATRQPLVFAASLIGSEDIAGEAARAAEHEECNLGPDDPTPANGTRASVIVLRPPE